VGLWACGGWCGGGWLDGWVSREEETEGEG
jgi:hypothetical protein